MPVATLAFGEIADMKYPNETAQFATIIVIIQQIINFDPSLFKFAIQYMIVVEMNGKNKKPGSYFIIASIKLMFKIKIMV